MSNDNVIVDTPAIIETVWVEFDRNKSPKGWDKAKWEEYYDFVINKHRDEDNELVSVDKITYTGKYNKVLT